MELLWQAIAIIAVLGLLLVLVFAVLEPGPLQKRRSFGKGRKTEEPGPQAAEDEASRG